MIAAKVTPQFRDELYSVLDLHDLTMADAVRFGVVMLKEHLEAIDVNADADVVDNDYIQEGVLQE